MTMFKAYQTTTDFVRTALERSGYNVEFTHSFFLRFSEATGNQVHSFFFASEEGEGFEQSLVFVSADGRADF